jgi:nucleoid-associated protein YgaU
MAATSMSRMVLPVAFVAACVMAFVAFQHVGREPPNDTKAATAAPAMSRPASGARDQDPTAFASAQPTANGTLAAVGGSAVPPDSSDGLPAFDIARIEPTGDSVIAGRASPGATVELLLNDEFFDRAIADRAGQFVMVPPRIPTGTYDLTLRAKQSDGKQALSKNTVAVVIEPSPNDPPLVALLTPDKPIVVLSQPTGPKALAGTVVVEAVETEPGGKLHVTGRARPAASLRLYLNDSFVASVTASADGRFAVTISEGVAPGSYRARLDEVESSSGAVRARAEVPFNVPEKVITGSPAQAIVAKRTDAAAQKTQLAGTGATVLSDGGSRSNVVVPKIATTTVARGDNLWRLSRVTYGAGTRYAVIYKANREQIRNPNRIYPGQIFVLPTQ